MSSGATVSVSGSFGTSTPPVRGFFRRLFRSRALLLLLLTGNLALAGLYLKALREGIELTQLLNALSQENAAREAGMKELQTVAFGQRQQLGQAEALVELLASPGTIRVSMVADPGASDLLGPISGAATSAPAADSVSNEAGATATPSTVAELAPAGAASRAPEGLVFTDRARRRLVIFVFGLREPARGEVLQAWGTSTDQQRARLGLMPPATQGIRTLFLPIQKPLTQVEIWAEPASGGEAGRRVFGAALPE